MESDLSTAATSYRSRKPRLLHGCEQAESDDRRLLQPRDDLVRQGEYDIALGDYNETICLSPRRSQCAQRPREVWCHKREYDKLLADYYETQSADQIAAKEPSTKEIRRPSEPEQRPTDPPPAKATETKGSALARNWVDRKKFRILEVLEDGTVRFGGNFASVTDEIQISRTNATLSTDRGRNKVDFSGSFTDGVLTGNDL